jgi:mono/diheme cytochrome c family protein
MKRAGFPSRRFSPPPPAVPRMGKVHLRIGAFFTAIAVLPALVAGFWLLAVDAGEQPRSSSAKPVDYTSQIKPILTEHCVTCHGAAKPRGGLRLDTAAAAMAGGKGGPAVLPGRGALSPLIEALRGDGATDRMPLNRPPLSSAEIKLIETWIDQGANAKPGEKPGVPPAKVHWAFVSPSRPAVPKVARKGWARNPIDCFIQARLEEAGLSPSAEADRRTLIRRLSLDLTGLPASPEEVDAFFNDDGPGAADRVVDRLLGSPHFGERWARLWLDQARYADSNGFNIDAPRSIWKYRDWVIAAINSGMAFDRFATLQLAGDLLPGDDFAPRIATGFHRNTLINQEGGIDVEQFRVESIVDRVNTTGTVFLGLTVGCAQCHDHKYDPISQREYYQLYAFFNNVDEPELEIATARELDMRRKARAEIDALHRAVAKKYADLDEREQRWEKTVNLEFTQAQEADVRLAFDSPREKRSKAQCRALIELMMASEADFRAEYEALLKLRAAEPKFVATMVVSEHKGRPRPSHIHLGGDFTRKGDRIEPGVPRVLPGLANQSPSTPADRLDLARWLVDRRNPLSARVVVNRIWQVYFGRGLVETDNDFGTQGSYPSHPELLDWLACELMDCGWSEKPIHRLIAGSRAYRQASVHRSDGQTMDPDNRLLWRQSRLRLDAELIRDAALACSGLLTRKVGGPSVFPPQPDGVMTLGQMKRPWVADVGPDRFRRGLYTFFWRATPNAFLTTFDAPGGVQTCTRRLRSNTPLQALTLLNDPASFEIAQGLAARILAERPAPATDRDRLERAFQLCLGRPASPSELETLEKLLEQERAEPVPAEKHRAVSRTSSSGSRGSVIGYPWVTIARVLLNLDEFVTRE